LICSLIIIPNHILNFSKTIKPTKNEHLQSHNYNIHPKINKKKQTKQRNHKKKKANINKNLIYNHTVQQ